MRSERLKDQLESDENVLYCVLEGRSESIPYLHWLWRNIYEN
jgi:hypothetical protein